MADYTVALADIGKHEKTLVAATVDTVTFTADLDRVEVINLDTSAHIYFTTNGDTPAVGDDGSYFLPAGSAREVPSGAGGTVVKLISAGTPKYSVSGAV